MSSILLDSFSKDGTIVWEGNVERSKGFYMHAFPYTGKAQPQIYHPPLSSADDAHIDFLLIIHAEYLPFLYTDSMHPLGSS